MLKEWHMDEHARGRRKVGIYGSRLVISAIGASLQQNPALDVQVFEEPLPGIAEETEAARPDVIVFDMAAAPPQFAIPLINANPAITLIGVDLARNEMLVLSGRQYPLLTAEDLAGAIQTGPPA